MPRTFDEDIGAAVPATMIPQSTFDKVKAAAKSGHSADGHASDVLVTDESTYNFREHSALVVVANGTDADLRLTQYHRNSGEMWAHPDHNGEVLIPACKSILGTTEYGFGYFAFMPKMISFVGCAGALVLSCDAGDKTLAIGLGYEVHNDHGSANFKLAVGDTLDAATIYADTDAALSWTYGTQVTRNYTVAETKDRAPLTVSVHASMVGQDGADQQRIDFAAYTSFVYTLCVEAEA